MGQALLKLDEAIAAAATAWVRVAEAGLNTSRCGQSNLNGKR